MSRIFKKKIGIDRMQLRDFVRHVDKIADRAEDVADHLSIFVIKRSL